MFARAPRAAVCGGCPGHQSFNPMELAQCKKIVVVKPFKSFRTPEQTWEHQPTQSSGMSNLMSRHVSFLLVINMMFASLGLTCSSNPFSPPVRRTPRTSVGRSLFAACPPHTAGSAQRGRSTHGDGGRFDQHLEVGSRFGSRLGRIADAAGHGETARKRRNDKRTVGSRNHWWLTYGASGTCPGSTRIQSWERRTWKLKTARL